MSADPFNHPPDSLPDSEHTGSARRGFNYLNRRRFLGLAGATVSSVLLAACGGDDDDAPATTTGGGAATATTEPATQTSSTATAAATAEATTAATSAASPTTAATETASGGIKIFRTAYEGSVQNMDPAFITSTPDNQLGEAIFNQIARYTYDPPLGTELIPELAESWDVSDDATEFTFHLVEGAQWHKGYGEVTADDVLYNWERTQNPDTGSRFGTDFDGATFEVVDTYTFKTTFAAPNPPFIRSSLAYVPGLIFSSKAMEEIGAENWKTNPIGSGPFQWGEEVPGSSVTIDRFEDYWGPLPKVNQIFNRVRVDPNSAVLAVSNGELDAFYILDAQIAVDTLNDPPPNTVFHAPELGQTPHWLAFHMQKPPLDDVRVRQAMRYAIDVEAIAEELFGGLASPIHSFLPPFMWGYSDDITKFNYDPDRAKALLEEAGVGSDWVPVVLGGGDSKVARDVVEIVGSYWADIGVNAQLDLIERAVFLERRYAGDYDIFHISVGRIEANQIATPYWKSGSQVNQSYYSAADDLIDAARSEPDEDARLELYRQLQDQISQDSPAAFIVATAASLIVNERVSGVSGAGWISRLDWWNIDVPAE